MNICHINLASGFSGGERQTLQLIKHQVELGYNLTVVANPKSPFYQEIEKLPCRLFSAKNYLRSHKKEITEECALIHVHEGRAIYWALIQSKLFNIPYIVTRRIDNPLKKKWLSNTAYKNATNVVGLSNEIIRQVKLRHKNTATTLIPSSPVSYPIDPVAVRQLKRRFHGKFLVIQAANLLAHKGHDVTIKAAHNLVKTHPNIHIAILGDGKERQTLETQAQGLTNVSFEGKQRHMGDWFASADLLIHPSYSEGLGSVILEAIQGGLAVIGTNAGGIPDIIEDGQSGRLVEPGDGDGLAAAIAEMATDHQRYQQLLEGGQQKLKIFEIEHTAQQYQALYQQIISEKTA